jgi:signal transduction histidine kinase
MEVDFRSDVHTPLPSDIGLCLFRVLQEALHNAVKHSGVARVEVKIAENSNEVQLMIRDSGKGFDIEVARQGNGLGLTSMQERVRLLNGTIGFASKPSGGGTTIRVCVPLPAENCAQRAAG